MSLSELAEEIRAAWDTLFKSAYVEHLENEVSNLRGQVARLTIVAELAAKPAPVAPRQFPKFAPPTKTSWEAYRDEQIALQEKEEPKDGTHSSGR